jgi:hypothetical protein
MDYSKEKSNRKGREVFRKDRQDKFSLCALCEPSVFFAVKSANPFFKLF